MWASWRWPCACWWGECRCRPLPVRQVALWLWAGVALLELEVSGRVHPLSAPPCEDLSSWCSPAGPCVAMNTAINHPIQLISKSVNHWLIIRPLIQSLFQTIKQPSNWSIKHTYQSITGSQPSINQSIRDWTIKTPVNQCTYLWVLSQGTSWQWWWTYPFRRFPLGPVPGTELALMLYSWSSFFTDGPTPGLAKEKQTLTVKNLSQVCCGDHIFRC